MTAFPSLVPNAISLNHGVPQVSEYEAFGIGPIRFRHNNYVNGQEFQLVYQALDQDSIELIRDHYQDNGGTSGQFTVPVSVLALINTTDSSSKYRYTETPTEEHIGLQRYNVTISLRAIEGILLEFVLDGGSTTVPAEETVDKFVFVGTAPFNMNGSPASQATLIVDGN
jgi:hypothetical protein